MYNIEVEGVKVAMVLKPSDYLDHKNKVFFSDTGDSVQIGALFFSEGSVVRPHRHKKVEGSPSPTEIVMVLQGSAEMAVYGEDNFFWGEYTLEQGDIMILKRGGHAFKFNEDAMLLEIKRGPYLGREYDKELI
jgi:quercetin dioxygenase-like cupin family protein